MGQRVDSYFFRGSILNVSKYPLEDQGDAI